MNKYSINLYLLLILCFITISMNGQGDTQPIDILDRWEDITKMQPGVSVAIIESGEIKFKKSVGYANLEYQIPLNENSIFDIASLAKQFTGFAVAKLIVEEKLRLNDEARTYLPELGILDSGILIKHLVYHTSGLRDVGGLFALSNQGEIFSSKEALALVKGQRNLNFSPGTEYDYSNTNYVLLAVIVEKITGQSFREWSEANLFSPFKMRSSFANDNPYEIINNRAVAYYSKDSSFSFQQNNGMSLIGSSAVYSNLNDMIIWAQALQKESLFPEVFKLMKNKGELDNGQSVDYGFGLSLGNYRDHDIIEHSGATPAGFRTQLAFMPDKDLAFIVLSNWGDIEPIRDLGKVIFNSYLPPQEDQGAGSAPTAPSIELTEQMAKRFVGEYLFNNEMYVTIRADNEANLTIELEGQEETPLIPLTDSSFSLPVASAIVVFHSGSASKNQTDRFESATVFVGGDVEGKIERKRAVEKLIIDHKNYQGLFHSSELNIVFELEAFDGKLYINNTKMGKVLLNEKTKEVFIPEEGVASSIVFSFNSSNEVDGFLLNRGSRMRDLEFFKIKSVH